MRSAIGPGSSICAATAALSLRDGRGPTGRQPHECAGRLQQSGHQERHGQAGSGRRSCHLAGS
eukprot:5658433-Prymnesium_polylepis.1